MAIVSDHLSESRLLNQPTTSGDVNGALAGFLEDLFQRLGTAVDDPGQVHRAMDDLFVGLKQRQQERSPQGWQEDIATCRQHQLLKLVHEDPFTRRAFEKPRGYAGDAVLLDYIYSREEPTLAVPSTTWLGRHVYDYTTLAPAAEGVRARRAIVSRLIDRFTERQGPLEMLSIAAGHLREASMAIAIKRRRFQRFVALDSDPTSLQVVQASYGGLGVDTFRANIRQLIARKLDLGRFDFVYSTGLFDYVGPAAARRLVSVLFGMLRSGGRLLVANFLPGIRDSAYMEAFMDWSLIYRTRQDMVDITMDVPQSEICDISLRAEEGQNIIFVEIRKL
jgi:SAM-dependent methyltransferase